MRANSSPQEVVPVPLGMEDLTIQARQTRLESHFRKEGLSQADAELAADITLGLTDGDIDEKVRT